MDSKKILSSVDRPPNFDSKVDMLVSLCGGNVSAHDAGVALDQKNYDLEAAADLLLNRELWEFETVSKVKTPKASKPTTEPPKQSKPTSDDRKETSTKPYHKRQQQKLQSEEQNASSDQTQKPNTYKQRREAAQHTDQQDKGFKKERRGAPRDFKKDKPEEAKETIIQLQSTPKESSSQNADKTAHQRPVYEKKFRSKNFSQQGEGVAPSGDQSQPPRGKYIPRGGKQLNQRKMNPNTPTAESDDVDHFTVRIVVRTVQTVVEEIPQEATTSSEIEKPDVPSPNHTFPTPEEKSASASAADSNESKDASPVAITPTNEISTNSPSTPAEEPAKQESAAKPIEKPVTAKPKQKKSKPAATWLVKQKSAKPSEPSTDGPLNKTPFSFGSVLSEVETINVDADEPSVPPAEDKQVSPSASVESPAKPTESQTKVEVSPAVSSTTQAVAEPSTPTNPLTTNITSRNTEVPVAQPQATTAEPTTAQVSASPSASASSTPSITATSVVSPSQPTSQVNSQTQSAPSRPFVPSPGPQQNLGTRPAPYNSGAGGFPQRSQVAADSYASAMYGRADGSVEDSTESPSLNPPSFTTNPAAPFFGTPFDHHRLASMGIPDPAFMYNQLPAVPGIAPMPNSAPNGKQQGRPHNTREKFPHNPNPADLANGMPPPYPFYPVYFAPPPYQFPYFPPYQNPPFNQNKAGPNGNFKPTNYPPGPGAYPFGMPYPMGFEEESHTYGMPYGMPTGFGDAQQLGPGAAGIPKPAGSAGADVGGRNKAPLPTHPAEYSVGQNSGVNASYGNGSRYNQPHGGNVPQYNPSYNPTNSTWGSH